MRNIKRIDRFLELVDNENLLTNIWKLPLDNGDLRAVLSLIAVKDFDIREYWNSLPDLRYSQVLVNMGIIPNYPGFWYFTEEDEILEQQGLPLSEYMLWGVNFDKDMNRLPETDYRFICDLDTDHIEAILDGQWTKNLRYIAAFNDELNRRKGG